MLEVFNSNVFSAIDVKVKKNTQFKSGKNKQKLLFYILNIFHPFLLHQGLAMGWQCFHWDYLMRRHQMHFSKSLYVFLNFLVISAWPAGIWSPPTWGLDIQYPCRSCTLCPVPSTTATWGTPTLTVQPPAITPPCQDCQWELQNLHQDQEAVATSSSVTSGWLASLPGSWGSDTFSWALQWEAVTQRKRPVLELFGWVFSTNLMSKGGLNYLKCYRGLSKAVSS